MSTSDMANSCSVPCNLCGSTQVEAIRSQDRHGAPLRSVICRDCGLVWTDPRPSPEQLRAFYEIEYRRDYKGTYQPQPKHSYRAGKVAVDRFKRIRDLLKPAAKVLDVGAGSGEVVYVLRAMGYDASGFEPNEGYSLYASEVLGLPVAQGFYQDAAVPAESQDFVTVFHALEHMDNPLDVLHHAHRWLRPGGLLLIEVPNSEATCQQPHTQFHLGHLYHFNLPTLENLGRRAGFTVERSETSADGGNITVIFRKASAPPLASGALPGNYDRVSSIMRQHTSLRHAFTLHPYLRPLRKFAARLEERRKMKRGRPAKAMLDALIREELTQD